MDIRECITDSDILSTYDIAVQLRPHLTKEEYLEAVKDMPGKYRLVGVFERGKCVGVGGFREDRRLSHGKFMYISDLVTDASCRGKGVGKMMMEYIYKAAKDAGFTRIVLDSGIQREDAHRFYFREGFTIKAYNFWKDIG